MVRNDAGQTGESLPRNLPGFFLLVLLLTIPFWVAQGLSGLVLLSGLPLSALAILAPLAAAALLVQRAGGIGALTLFLSRAVDKGRPAARSACALAALLPVLILVLALVIAGRPVTLALSLPTILALCTIFLLTACAEELGWMGYAYDPMKRRFGVIGAGLWLGVIWAAWHYIPLFQVGRGLDFIAWWTLGTIAMRIIIVCLYEAGGGSLLAAILFHAMSNVCWQLYPEESPFDPRMHGIITGAVAILLVAITARRSRPSA